MREFKAEPEMTWEQWVNSEYNTSDFYTYMDLVVYSSRKFLVGGERSEVYKNQIINKDEYYFVNFSEMA